MRIIHDISELRPLTDEEVEEHLQALEIVRRHREERLAEDGGKPYSPTLTELVLESRYADLDLDAHDSDGASA